MYLSEHEFAPALSYPQPDVRVRVCRENEKVDGIHRVRGVGVLGSCANDEKRADQLQGVDGGFEVENDRVQTLQGLALERVVEEEAIVHNMA